MQLKSSHTAVLPVLSLLLAATLWGMYWYPLRWLAELGITGAWIVLLVYAATLIYVPFLVGRRWREFGQSPWLLLGIALASGICNTVFILGVLEGNVIRVTLLFFLSPIWATLLARFFLKEQLTAYSYFTLALAFCGALLILYHPAIGWPWPQARADWYGLIAGLAFALANVCINKADCVSTPVKTTAIWLGGIVVAGLLILLQAPAVVIPDAAMIRAALLVGVIGMGVMTLAVTYGISHLPIHRSAVIMLFEVVVASVSTLLLTEVRPRPIEWFGGGLVIIAAYLAMRHLPMPEPSMCDTKTP